MSQTDEKTVTVNSIMREPAFQQGMTDYWRGAPIPLRLPPQAEYSYERGRLFAAATGQKYVHSTRGQVKPQQLYAFGKLLRDRSIL